MLITNLLLGSGCGAVLEEWWIYLPWSNTINGQETTRSGRRVGRKLSALELVAPLAILCGAPDKVRGRALRIMVDNAGSVAIWRKGYSTKCELSSTLVRAMFEVSASLECRVEVTKVTRCSDIGSEMADALSKAEFLRFRELTLKVGYPLNKNMGEVPKSLLDWIQHPTENLELGREILEEMSLKTKVLGYDNIY